MLGLRALGRRLLSGGGLSVGKQPGGELAMGLQALGRLLLSGGELSAGKRPGEGGAARQRAGGGFAALGDCFCLAEGLRLGSGPAEAGELAIWCPCADSRRVGAERAAPRRRAGPSGTAIAAEGSGEPVGVGGASARCLPGGEPQLLPYRQRGAPGGGRTGPFSRCGCGEKRSPSPNRQNPGVCCRKMQHFRVFHKKNTENLRFIHK